MVACSEEGVLFIHLFCFGERVLDTQKRPRLVSCVLSPERVYFCFLSNFYFDVYRRRLSGPSARLAQRYSSRKPLFLGGLRFSGDFCAIKDSARVCGSCSVWRTCGNTGVFSICSSFCFPGD
jgi:hypothetical protein